MGYNTTLVQLIKEFGDATHKCTLATNLPPYRDVTANKKLRKAAKKLLKHIKAETDNESVLDAEVESLLG